LQETVEVLHHMTVWIDRYLEKRSKLSQWEFRSKLGNSVVISFSDLHACETSVVRSGASHDDFYFLMRTPITAAHLLLVAVAVERSGPAINSLRI